MGRSVARHAPAKLLVSCSLALPAFFSFHDVARAQAAIRGTKVETVVVTAEKRAQNIQKVPISISAYSGAELEENNISSVADLSGYVPSLNINQANNNRNSQIIIRNVGTAGTNPGTEPDVGVFIDGVYIPVAGPIYNELADIATVEVLRGPQGTLYGRNTPVGAINITTRVPTQQREGMIDLQYGNYGLVRVKGYYGGGITDDLAGRVAFWSDSNGGYLKNIYNDTRVDSSNQYGGRARLRWTPDADTTVDFIGYYAHIRAENNGGQQVDPLGQGGIVYGYAPTPKSFATSPFVVAQKSTNPLHPYVVTGPWEVNSATAAPDNTTSWGLSARASHDVHAIGATLVNILAYNSYLDDAPSQGPGGLPLALVANLQNDQSRSTSDEVQVISDGTHFIDYVAGLYLFHNDLSYTAVATVLDQANRLFPPTLGGGHLNPGDQSMINFGQYTNSAAVYGQATVHITSRLRGIGGLRYSYDHKGSTVVQSVTNITTGIVSPAFLAQTKGDGTLSGKLTDHSLTWIVGAQYDVTRRIMAYATMSSGFKDGGFNSRSATAKPYVFNPETSLNYEIGGKTSWFNEKLVLNLDVFRMLVHGYQQSTLTPQGVGFVVNNAGNFRNQGLEMDLQAHPIDPLSLTGSLSYVASKITGGADLLQCDLSYPVAGSLPPPTSGPFTNATHADCNYNGLTLADAPRWQWSAGGRWEQPWKKSPYDWYVSASVTGVSSQYLYPLLDPRSLQSGYALLNAAVGVESEDGVWRAQIWARNLTDKHYFIAEAPQPQAAYVSGGATKPANGYIGWPGDPRTIGVEVTYHF